MSSCNDSGVDNGNLSDNINKSCDIDCSQSLIHEFYRYNQKLEQESSNLVHEDWYDSLNYYWNEILVSEQSVREYLMSVHSSNKKGKALMYGWDFMDANNEKSLLENNVHILFLLKALDEGSFLFASDKQTKELGFIKDYCSVFPVFIYADDTLPKVSRFTNSKGDTYPIFDNSKYSKSIDSIIELISTKNRLSSDDINVLWVNFKDSIWFDALLVKK